MSQLDTDIGALQATVTAQNTVVASVLALVQGIPALIDAAVQKALAAGATPAQLAAIEAVSASVKANDDALAAAVAANTPTP